ncbi:MAG TPA: haloacid dehalogenase type II [Steroidobacteraceae bacterium]|jgi:2-haloacid dehalogenase|nr:haloacid dehalogenase type II [Steroidobacteraceae bacterium]
MKLTDFKALTFDCYGTLIDWESGILAALEPLAARVKPRPSRNALLEAYAVHEHAQELQTPHLQYSQLLAVTYKRMAENFSAPASWEECVAFGQSLRSWAPFPDTVSALQYLKRHYRLYVLSNVDNASFSYTNRKLEVQFDGVMTAEDIGSYKPSLRNFEYLLERLATQGIRKEQILHVAQSLTHDHAPANRIGLASCWIDRRHGQAGGGATKPPDTMPRLDFKFDSLGELAEAHRKLVAN